MPQSKTAIAVRIHPELLAQVRAFATRDNRSLTNFIETALRERIGDRATQSIRARLPANLGETAKSKSR